MSNLTFITFGSREFVKYHYRDVLIAQIGLIIARLSLSIYK